MDITDNALKMRELALKELELRSNHRISIIKIITSGVVVTLIPAIINYQIQQQQVEIKRLEGEVSYLEKFSDHVVEQSDLTKRKNFVEYLATIAHSEASRERWAKYLAIVEALAQQQEAIDEQILAATAEAEQAKLRLTQLESMLRDKGRSEPETEQLETSLKQVRQSVIVAEQRISQKAEEKRKLIENASLTDTAGVNAGFVVGLQTVGVDNQERLAINERVAKAGYALDPITYSYPADKKPNWFADSSTVFYYSANARHTAEKLAHLMESYTHTPFDVKRGAGLGVEPDKRSVTFFVHYIKNDN